MQRRKQMSRAYLSGADLTGADVLEIAPGLGRTAVEILALDPRSYRGVESDEAAATMAEGVVGDRGTITVGQAQDTGLAADSVDVRARRSAVRKRHADGVLARRDGDLAAGRGLDVSAVDRDRRATANIV
jgi:predicted RNA methylase